MPLLSLPDGSLLNPAWVQAIVWQPSEQPDHPGTTRILMQGDLVLRLPGDQRAALARHINASLATDPAPATAEGARAWWAKA